MSDAVVDYQATNLHSLHANFKTQTSTTTEGSETPNVKDEKGNVACESNIIDMTSYTQNAQYCGSDFMADFVDTSAAPVSFLENFGCTFNSKLVDSISIGMSTAGPCTVDISSHNHDTNAHDGGATPTGATRADALALGIADVSDFLPHEVAEAFAGWDGFGIPDFGIDMGTPATASPSNATVTFSFESHPDTNREDGKHLVGKNLTPKCELSMDFSGIPTSSTKTLLNADFAANTNSMLGAITTDTDGNDSNSESDTMSITAHAFADLATV